MQTEFIETIHFNGAEKLIQKLRECEKDEKIRALVLIFDFKNSEFTGDFSESLKNFPAPVISVFKENIPKNASSIMENSHLCIAAQSKNALEAFENGLINKIAAPENVEIEALKLAEEISKNAPLAVRACLKAVNRGFEMSLEDGLKLESELFAKIFKTEDMREGTRAFLEKRKPAFKGK